jgi:hypothetical protein
MITQAITFISV